ncbi:hypothetical protein V495_07045 [Pseudogymnoascus sp. VKM F-4514 (FW-929)]|nr:hypothetical protein V495_07045 [Pseudogymnoascus sp. VKM F-4514 (FW-929)]
MSQSPPLYNFAIQPPPVTPPSTPLVPPPTFILSESPISELAPTANNLVAVASLVPASIESAVADLSGVSGDDLAGTLAVPATPLGDGSGFQKPLVLDVADLSGVSGDDLAGTLAVPATPLGDSSGVGFVFRNLRIERPGNWKIRIIVLRMSDERNGAGIGRAQASTEGAVVGVELVSRVVSVEEGAPANENISASDQGILNQMSE